MGSAKSDDRESDRVSAFTASLDSGGQIDLSALSQNDKVIGAYEEAGAGYGAAIDRFIADPLRRTRLEAVANFAQPIRLLSAGRIDFIFGTLIDINYRLRLAGSADPVTALKIRDAVVSTPEEWGYVACSNQATGRALIDRIDAILTPQGGHSAYLESLKHWYGPEDFETALRTGLQVK